MEATVVGNFPRVGDSLEQQRLRRAIDAWQQGKVDIQEVIKFENELTVEAINEQINAGISLITDGQIRWVEPLTWIAGKLKGIKITGLIRLFDNNVYYRQPVIEGPVGWQEPILVKDFEFAQKTAAGRAQVKAVLPAPYTLARLSKNNHYKSLQELVMDMAKAIKQEAEALVKAGATFIQFDDPSLPYNPEDFAMAAKALEMVTSGLGQTKTAVYTYFTSVNKIFPNVQKLPVHILGLDLVSDTGNLKLLKDNKFEKDLAIGIIDGRNTKLENENDLKTVLKSLDKNQEKIKYVNPSSGLEFLPRDVAIKKLKLTGALARQMQAVTH